MTIFLAQKNRIFQDFKNFQQQIIDFCICILYDVMFARSTKHLHRLSHKISILNTSQQNCHFAKKEEVELHHILICRVEK